MCWLTFWKKLSTVKVSWQVAGVCYIDTYFRALILVGTYVSFFVVFIFLIICGGLNTTANLAYWCEGICWEMCSDWNIWRVKCAEFALNFSSHFTNLRSSLYYTMVLTSVHGLLESLMNFKTDTKLCLIRRLDFYQITLEHQLYARYEVL